MIFSENRRPLFGIMRCRRDNFRGGNRIYRRFTWVNGLTARRRVQ